MSDEETILLNLFDSYWFEYGVLSEKKRSCSAMKTSPVLQVQAEEEMVFEKPKLKPIKTLMRKSSSDQFLSSKDCSDSSGSPSLDSVLVPQPQTILSGKEIEDSKDCSDSSGSPSPDSVLVPQPQTILSGKEIEDSKDCSDSSGSPSPDSVLVPQLQTILSGKKNEEFPEEKEEQSIIYSRNGYETNWNGSRVYLSHTEPSVHEGKKRRRRMGRKGSGKSLSELEFEELKGFMDLGFVFSDKDKDSRLVSIIPGLQRLGINSAEESDKSSCNVSVSRPYLSEAWEFVGDEKNPLIDWRIPAFGNEMELKDHLRFWAHTVASTVR